MNELGWVRATAIFVAATWLLIIFGTWMLVSINWQDNAVNKGYAEYYINKSHQKRWRWLCDEREDEIKKNGE